MLNARARYRSRPSRSPGLAGALGALLLAVLAGSTPGCEPSAKKSAELAGEQAAELARAAREDAREIREGLPKGAAELEKLLQSADGLDPQTAREALDKARGRVQDLRTAKSTFFALVSPDGTVIRNDQEQDRMAGKGIFAAFPALKGALDGKYVETRGSMPEAAEVRGRPDAQWVAASLVRKNEQPVALFVTGISWSFYAYRLQNSIRGKAQSKLGEHESLPLLYAFVVVGDKAYGARDAPDVNIESVERAGLGKRVTAGAPFKSELEITGRAFGLGAARASELGDDVVLVVLRSET